MVSYTDAKRNVDEGQDVAFDEAARDRAGLVSANPVAEDTRNRAPVFGDEDSDTPGTQNQSATREVAENTKGNVGNAVTAEDPDPNEDTLVYTLSGADAGLFTVAATTEDGTDHSEVRDETGLRDGQDHVYMVTLTATDSFSDSASIDVTIMVTDADEPPDVSGDVSKPSMPRTARARWRPTRRWTLRGRQ